MPHVVIKLWPGRTEIQKEELVLKIVKDVVEVLDVKESSVSVAIEEIPSESWGKLVYKPEILDKKDTLYKKPEYHIEESEL